MSTDLTNERNAFNAFVDSRFGSERCDLTLEEALAEFRAYQRELNEVREKIREAKESSARGESAELDIEELVQDITDDLAAEGISD